MSLLRLPVTIPEKPGNDGGSKEIHALFCRHHRTLHHPDPVVSALMQKGYLTTKDTKHTKKNNTNMLNVGFRVTFEIEGLSRFLCHRPLNSMRLRP